MRSNIWNGTISFGLISIPVGVHSAEQDKDLHFNLLDEKNLAPVKYRRVNGVTGKEVDNSRIIKGYQYEKGKYVLMTPEDFRRANPKATRTIDIEAFIKLDDVDVLLFEKPYYLVPDKGGEKAYALLQQALLKSKKAAIAKMVMHTKERLVCLFPKDKVLVLEIMRFAHQVKSADDLKIEKPRRTSFQAQELKMAKRLIDDMTTTWKPERYKDTYYGDLMKHIQGRIKAGKGKEISHETEEQPMGARATGDKDLLGLLRNSLNRKKKPAEKRMHH